MSNDDSATTEESPIGTRTRVPPGDATEEPDAPPIAIGMRAP
ncbi:hypothetical protein ACFQMF_03910 [Halorubrum rutilum]|uniref:Uncharacterized protein n=1 Tax=Halorubrum rutilum TaxID=1364933 RepID=A0ABD6AHQ1_9EURY|nr:hypothetical protein [Halorubrum rutilum]